MKINQNFSYLFLQKNGRKNLSHLTYIYCIRHGPRDLDYLVVYEVTIVLIILIFFVIDYEINFKNLHKISPLSMRSLTVYFIFSNILLL